MLILTGRDWPAYLYLGTPYPASYTQVRSPARYSERSIARMAACPCILYQRLQMRLDRHVCAVHAVTDMLRSVCLTYLCRCCAAEHAAPYLRDKLG